MAGYRWAQFVGCFPSKPKRLLQPNELTSVVNVQLDRGTLRPFPASSHVRTPAATTRSIYLYRDPDDAQPDAWLEFDDFDVSIAASPIVNDAYDRVYWTGDTNGDTAGRAKVASRDDIFGAVGGTYPEGYYYLGVPAVGTTVTAARTVGSAPSADLASSYIYCVTYSTSYGEEGPPSNVTAIIDVDDSAEFEVTVTVPHESAPDTNRDITHVNLYVAYAGTSQDDWKFVKQVSRVAGPTATTVTHEVPIADLSVPLVSTDWEVPPTDMRGLKAFGSGLAGYSKNELCFSEAGFPHAWPVAYRLPTEVPITGIGVYGNTIFVGTMGAPYIAYGHSPDAMVIERLQYDQACVNLSSVVEMEDGVVWASPTGLHMVRGNSMIDLTSDIWSREDFAALDPTTFRSARWGSMYVCQYDDGATKNMFALYPAHPERGVVFLDQQDIHAFYYDLISDKLYYVDQTLNTIRELFDLSAADLTMSVTSGTFVSVRPTNMAWMQVAAYTYPLSVHLYADGESVGGAQTITDGEAIRMPSGYLAREFYVIVSSDDEIESIAIAESSRDLREIT